MKGKLQELLFSAQHCLPDCPPPLSVDLQNAANNRSERRAQAIHSNQSSPFTDLASTDVATSVLLKCLWLSGLFRTGGYFTYDR
jgi:hypothetical protein